LKREPVRARRAEHRDDHQNLAEADEHAGTFGNCSCKVKMPAISSGCNPPAALRCLIKFHLQQCGN
jgi:hypothetical protein